MIGIIKTWLGYKWREQEDAELLAAYGAFARSTHGQRILQHLMDNVYCTVYEGTDPISLATHNGRRSVVNDMLLNIDKSENSQKYVVQQGKEENWDARMVR